jgi:hypothetical protein
MTSAFIQTDRAASAALVSFVPSSPTGAIPGFRFMARMVRRLTVEVSAQAGNGSHTWLGEDVSFIDGRATGAGGGVTYLHMPKTKNLMDAPPRCG